MTAECDPPRRNVSDDERKPGRPWPASANLAILDYPTPPDDRVGATGHVFDHLRYAILYGELAPGAWLRQTELAAHFNVSRTPIREALRALEREGLVRMIPYHGAQVTPLSLETFEEIYALRGGAEALAARKAAEAAGPSEHAALTLKLDALTSTARQRPVADYLAAEWALRLACYQLTGRERLIETIQQLREASERYLRLAYRLETDVFESLAFHRALVAAIGDNDGNRAETLNRAALQWTLDRVTPIVSTGIQTAG